MASAEMGDVFRWPCSVWIESAKRWALCKLYLYEDKLAISLVRVWDVEPEVRAVYISVDLSMLLDARLSHTWTGYRSLVLVADSPADGVGPSSWSGFGARECLSGNELWLSYLKSATSTLNAIQMFRRSSLLRFCRENSAPLSLSGRSQGQAGEVPSLGHTAVSTSRPAVGGQANSDALAKIAALAADSEGTLNAAAVELASQRESLERSHGKLQQIAKHLKVSSRLLSQVSSFFPAMRLTRSTQDRGVHSDAATTHCVLYSTEGSARMLAGRLGLYSLPSGGGGVSKVNVVLQGATGIVLDDTNVMAMPVDAHRVNLVSTSADGARRTTVALCCNRVSDIFKMAVPVTATTTPPAADRVGCQAHVMSMSGHRDDDDDEGSGDVAMATVSESLQRMKAVAMSVGDELRGQNELLDDMYEDAEGVTTEVRVLTGKMAVAV